MCVSQHLHICSWKGRRDVGWKLNLFTPLFKLQMVILLHTTNNNYIIKQQRQITYLLAINTHTSVLHTFDFNSLVTELF